MTKITAQIPSNKSVERDLPITEQKTFDNSEAGKNSPTVIADDKRFGMQMQADIKRSQLQNAVSAQTSQTTDENTEINKITNKTILKKDVLPDETQESFLRRTYEELAFKAGISNEKAAGQEKSPKEMFIEERINALKDENGVVRMGNRGTKEPNDVFSDENWKKLGNVTYHVGDADVEALKKYKAQDSYNEGVKAANTLKEAMNRGYKFGDLFTSGEFRPDVEKAIQTIKTNEGNVNFQDGIMTTLGSDDFVKTEKYFAGSKYEGVLRNTLSVTGNELQTGKARFKPTADIQTIQKEIVQKSDLEQLSRLTKDETKPMGKDFLVEAGKKVTTPQLGWKTSGVGSSTDRLTQQEYVVDGTNEVLTAISRSPQASLELLQNEDFVKNGLRMSNMENGKTNSIVADIIKKGTSKEITAANPQQVETAIKTISESLKNKDYLSPDSTINTNNEIIGLTKNRVTPEIAQALADVYVNNAELFSNAAGRDAGGNMNSDDAGEFIKTLQPYYSVKDEKGNSVQDKVALATAIEYNKLILKAKETGNMSYAERAANLAGNYINGSNTGNLEAAKEADARRELLSKLTANSLEVVTFNLSKGTGDIAADLIGKVVATGTETGLKGNAADNAEEQNKTLIKNQRTTNSVSVVQTFEADEYAIASGSKESTAEQKKNAEKFLSDLKLYNESLPANAKILDSNGRLINPSQMTGFQKQSLEDIFSGRENPGQSGLYDRMERMRDKLNNTTEQKLH